MKLNSDFTQIICQGCQRRVAFDLSDCPWCGASLAYGQPVSSKKEAGISQGASLLNEETQAETADFSPFPRLNFAQPQLSLSSLQQSGWPLAETTYLTLGGGLGSFTWVDHLVIHGVNPEQITAIGLEAKPYARCRRLCRNSQIPAEERLRSDSGATPDNIWGWPGYALREIWADLKRGQLGQARTLAWQIFCESLTEPFTPQSGAVFAAIEREARRIGWPKIWRFGRVWAIRKTDDERYVVAYSQTTPRPRSERPRLMIAPYLHIALGYPQMRFLPDLQHHRAHTGDFKRFVNAYEPHDHIYQHLRRQGGTVLLRGRGITASRIIQRLSEERQHQPRLNILHLMRHPIPQGSTYQQTHRLAEHHFELQPFNFPKSCFGGEHLFTLEQTAEQERAALLKLWGGTTTARHAIWREIINTGLAEGWYQIRFGDLKRVEVNQGQLTVSISYTHTVLPEKAIAPVDFIIDATGLNDRLEQSPLWRDLLHTYHLKQNPSGKLHVTPHFELPDLRNGQGGVFASGIATAGGAFAPVDSFTGLQYAAQRSLEALIALNAPGLHELTPLSSVAQWWRWVRGLQP